MSNIEDADCGLKLYKALDPDSPEWIVSGTSKKIGKRWRKRFVDRGAAEMFFSFELQRLGALQSNDLEDRSTPHRENEIQGPDDRRIVSQTRLKSKSFRRQWQRAASSGQWMVKWSRSSVGVAVVAIVSLLAVWVFNRGGHASVHLNRVRVSGAVLFEKSFGKMGENSPRPADLLIMRNTIEVTREAWSSPLLSFENFEWYRIKLRSRAISADRVELPSRSGLCEVICLDDIGDESAVIASIPLPASTKWESCDRYFRISVPSAREGKGALVTAHVKLRSDRNDGLQVDGLVLERISHWQVLERADRGFDDKYMDILSRERVTRWERLPNALAKLRSRQKLRVAFGCDDRQRELSEVPVDAFLERLYPGAIVEVFPIVGRGDPGKKWENAIETALKLGVDVFVVGGVIDEMSLGGLQSAVDTLKAGEHMAKKKTEILILTTGWGVSDEGLSPLRLTSNIQELDQEMERNSSIPDDPRGRLLQFAARNGVEFFDVMGIAGEVIFGGSGPAHHGPETFPDGVPYRYFTRDWLDQKQSGPHLLGKILEAYFSPAGVRTEKASRRENGSGLISLPHFDPGKNIRDQKVLAGIKSVFNVKSVEQPVFMRDFRGDDDFWTEGDRSARFRVSEPVAKEAAFCFDEPVDVRAVDLLVYWAFHTQRSAGEERGELTASVGGGRQTASVRDESGRIALTVKPGGVALFGGSGKGSLNHHVEHLLETPIDVFLDYSKCERFRLVIRWLGGARIAAEAAVWDDRAREWKGLIPFDRPGAPPVVMEINNVQDLLGSTAFRELCFETQSRVPVLEAVLATTRPAIIIR